MSRTGYIYKLYCDGIDEFYIGSTWNMKERKTNHKHKCYSDKYSTYNSKVYQYIRENQGFDNWKFEILETNEFENEHNLKIREQHYKNLLNPSLNTYNANTTEEQRKAYVKNYDKIRCIKNIRCGCGSLLSKATKKLHEGSDKHQKYLQNITIHNLQNLTININISSK
jgi:hypothetical protein